MWLTAFTSIRVYAIDGQQWMKASVVMILGLVPVTLNIVNIFSLWILCHSFMRGSQYGSSKESVYCTAEVGVIGYSFSASKSNRYVRLVPIYIYRSLIRIFKM